MFKRVIEMCIAPEYSGSAINHWSRAPRLFTDTTVECWVFTSLFAKSMNCRRRAVPSRCVHWLHPLWGISIWSGTALPGDCTFQTDRSSFHCPSCKVEQCTPLLTTKSPNTVLCYISSDVNNFLPSNSDAHRVTFPVPIAPSQSEPRVSVAPELP